MLLEHRRRFLQPVFEALGGFEGLETAGPAALPVQGQGAEANDGDAKAHEAPIGNAVEIAQPWGLAIELAGQQRALKELEGSPGAVALRSIALLERNGNHNIEQGLRKSCLLYTSPSPRDLSTSRMPSSA